MFDLHPNVLTYLAAIDAFNRNDLTAVAQQVRPDFVYRIPDRRFSRADARRHSCSVTRSARICRGHARDACVVLSVGLRRRVRDGRTVVPVLRAARLQGCGARVSMSLSRLACVARWWSASTRSVARSGRASMSSRSCFRRSFRHREPSVSSRVTWLPWRRHCRGPRSSCGGGSTQSCSVLRPPGSCGCGSRRTAK